MKQVFDREPAALRKSEAALLTQLKAPAWRFWVGFAGRAVAAKVLGEKSRGGPGVVEALVAAARDDPSLYVRLYAAEAVGFVSHRGRLGEADPGELVDMLVGWLRDPVYADYDTHVLRDIGLIGKPARRAEAAVRAFLQPKVDSATVHPLDVVWSSFALARIGDDPGGAVQALGVVLNSGMATSPALYAVELLGHLAEPLVPALRELRGKGTTQGGDRDRIDQILAGLKKA